MNYRLDILRAAWTGTQRDTGDHIEDTDPLPGAKEFLDKLRESGQAIIISDTFTQFAKPLMKKLGWPTIFCNELVVGENGEITDFRMRMRRQV